MFVEVYPGGRMGYAFTDVRAVTDVRPDARTDVRPSADASTDVRPRTDVRRPARAPHSGRPVRRDPGRADGGGTQAVRRAGFR